jgi:hypothetical protein
MNAVDEDVNQLASPPHKRFCFGIAAKYSSTECRQPQDGNSENIRRICNIFDSPSRAV